ncbi:MAG: head GIN domain-containing protein [Chitinophagaceae bacterium]
MKRILFIALLAFPFAGQAQKGDRKKIEGSGNVITRDISIGSFDELEAGGVFNLRLSQGDKEQVRIEAEDNLQDLFIVKNEGATLSIRMKNEVSINTRKKMIVYVTFKKLKSMDLSMVGGTESDKNLNFTELRIKNHSVGSVSLSLSAQSLRMDNESVGSVSLKGKAETAKIKSSSVGNIRAGEFVVQKMEIDNTGVGSAEVNAARELIVKDSFLGKVKNKGGAVARKLNKSEI